MCGLELRRGGLPRRRSRVPGGQRERHDAALGQDAEGDGHAGPQQTELDGGYAVQLLVEPPGVEEGEQKLADLQGEVDLEVQRPGCQFNRIKKLYKNWPKYHSRVKLKRIPV